MTTTTVILDNRVDTRNIVNTVRHLKGVIDVKLQKGADFEHIYGLPYTQEEQMESIRMAEEDIRKGRVYSAKEIRSMFPKT